MLCSRDAFADGAPSPLVLDATQVSGIDIERLRAAIAHETGREVVLDSSSKNPDEQRLVVTTSNGQLHVVFDARHIERTVPLEAGEGRQVRQIALLVGDLTRGDADELLKKAPKRTEAAEPVTPAPPKRRSQSINEKKVTLTWSTFQSAGGFAEIGAEAKATRKVGLGGSLGFAFLHGLREDFWNTKDVNYLAVEVGFSPRYYVIGDFDHGVQLGLQAKVRLGFHDTFLIDRSSQIPLSISAGPYVGYKYTAPFGLTIEFQVGIAGAAGTGYSDLAAGFGLATPAKLVSVSQNGLNSTGYGALLNANIGWSF